MYKSLPDSQICLMVPGPNIWNEGSMRCSESSPPNLWWGMFPDKPLRGTFWLPSLVLTSLQDVLWASPVMFFDFAGLWPLLNIIVVCPYPQTHPGLRFMSPSTPSSDPFLSAQGPPEARTLFLPCPPPFPFCIWNLCTYRLHISCKELTPLPLSISWYLKRFQFPNVFHLALLLYFCSCLFCPWAS